MKKICTVIGSRANYSSIKSAMRAIQAHPDLELQLVCVASALLDRYGQVVNLIERDGFKVDEKLHILVEGETPATMVKSTGMGLIELSSVFDRLEPDVVITVGDRFETMATTLAAAYMNIPVAHTMGGEVSGTIDESIRHAVTKFAHIHFPASRDAAERILKLGELPEMVFRVGCPRIDLVADILKEDENGRDKDIFALGVGSSIDLTKPFAIVSQHPVTTEYGEGERQITATLKAVRKCNLPAVVLWPNADAGSEDIARGIRKWREHGSAEEMHFFKNLPIDTYVRLMRRAACLIGNSSSGIREGAFIGTPVVNIGSRQTARERGDNVIDAAHEEGAIADAIMQQKAHGRYQMQDIYGDGTAGVKIADVLAGLGAVEVQKLITY
ncbi:UDP-N-acetylglucosamine 2-epimerase [Undibacter mobilis]|uniref:UDP-N-acetylglucosamine 2-epimerase (Hydrolyzing) n=1 Tax=Undibacter mobilis TaxID=2292256 RepID=A0A371B6J7_9BRAD|nr:UDP-N-acetylglucosamine 2-epimerase [Undibacter mobilis]RDV03142.1 UDP-N-acetylglucosamine 2-epimerase (hydrolyzing) [Undibacter mobilis]